MIKKFELCRMNEIPRVLFKPQNNSILETQTFSLLIKFSNKKRKHYKQPFFNLLKKGDLIYAQSAA